MTESEDFNHPQRQSLIGILVYLLRNARVIVSLVIAFIAIGNENPMISNYLLVVLIVGGLITAVISYLQYRNFTFHIEQEELVIHRGVLVKERKTIPLDRIQSVHIEQNIIQQALSVVGLKIDSAGSTEKELEIAALREPVARSFRDLLKKKPASKPPDAEEDALPREPDEEELVVLSPIDLLKVGLTENHVRNGLVAILVVYGYITQYLDFTQGYMEDYLQEYVDQVPGTLIRASLAIIVASVVVFILVSILISLGRTILKFYRFRAVISDEVVELTSGLLKRNEIRIPVHKIQYLKWESNPLRRMMGFETVQIYQVQPGQMKKKTRVEIPACYPAQSQALERLVYNEEIPQTDKFESIHADKWAYTRFYSVIFGLPVLIWSAVQYFFYPVFWYLPLLLLPLIVFLAYKYGKSVRISFLKDYMIIQKGWILPKRTVISYHKGQAVRFSDNVFIRRRNLAHLVLHTASGAVRIRYLEVPVVREFVDYALFRIESSDKNWM